MVKTRQRHHAQALLTRTKWSIFPHINARKSWLGWEVDPLSGTAFLHPWVPNSLLAVTFEIYPLFNFLSKSARPSIRNCTWQDCFEQIGYIRPKLEYVVKIHHDTYKQ